MPMTRQRLILAICPTSDPTAPAAPDTTTVSPACGRQISSSPKYAVRPGIPRTYNADEMGPAAGSIWRNDLPGAAAYSCQPSMPSTVSPAEWRGSFDSTTRPTTPPTITSPRGVARAGLAGRDGLPHPDAAPVLPRHAWLPDRRLRLHHLHREFGPLGGADRGGDCEERPGRGVRPVGEPQFRGEGTPEHQGELPHVAPAGRGVRPRGPRGHRPDPRSPGKGERREGRVPQRHLADPRRGQEPDAIGPEARGLPEALFGFCLAKSKVERDPVVDGRHLRVRRHVDVYPGAAVLRGLLGRARPHRRAEGGPGAGHLWRLRDDRPHLAGGLH